MRISHDSSYLCVCGYMDVPLDAWCINKNEYDAKNLVHVSQVHVQVTKSSLLFADLVCVAWLTFQADANYWFSEKQATPNHTLQISE